MFHTLMYRVTAGVNDANVDMAMVTDTILIARNNHLLLTDRMSWLAAMHMGVSVLRVRTNFPSWNNFGRHTVYPVNRAVIAPSDPRIDDYRDNPLELPMGEELALEESGNLGAATEAETTQLWLAPRGGWNRNLPQGQFSLTVRATAAVAGVAGVWSGGGAITFSDNLKGGWYAITGCYCQDASSRAFRFIFPQFPGNSGRNWRPGSYMTSVQGNQEARFAKPFNEDLGVWGYFSTLEQPLLEVFNDATGALTQEMRINLVYLGSPGTTGFSGMVA
jgi:hypothetical protein